ncbi:DUF502 domain-containing protein [Thioalkalivibrio sp. XN8]|uniref:DUF502 domain-containing protein n=1 Tax=Thioalkalivibrio sp. XN8 TaxID=2712863 RepID=UPI0013ECF3A6|nr:DUF502 domain-containing protein [Thioalkalivibrio sp. XN8]NGP52141.1 DUF502 domain-containing protein [Thioalkalivibrio sp. XN8]
MLKTLRKYLVTGLILWIPLVVTFLVVRFLIGFVDRILLLLPEPLRPENLLGFSIPGLGLLLAVVILLFSGLFVTNFAGRRLVEIGDRIVARIPLVRGIYSSSKQVAETLFADHSTAFKRVLLVEYPRRGLWSMCFQTSDLEGEVQYRTAQQVVCVFLPTTPNPTSGYVLFVPRDELVALDMKVDEGLRFIISLGVAIPRWTSPEAAKASLARPETPQ